MGQDTAGELLADPLRLAELRVLNAFAEGVALLELLSGGGDLLLGFVG